MGSERWDSRFACLVLYSLIMIVGEGSDRQVLAEKTWEMFVITLGHLVIDLVRKSQTTKTTIKPHDPRF